MRSNSTMYCCSGFETEDVLHLEVFHLSRFAFGVDHESVTVAKHPTDHAIVLEGGVIEITQHRLLSRHVHRQVVIRPRKGMSLFLMAVDASGSSNVGGL